MARAAKPTYFILDVDGVFTNGQFLYTASGKYAKVFGPHDADGLKLIRPYIKAGAITADKRGYEITAKRIHDDMGLPLTLVSEPERLDYFKKKLDPVQTIYMGDGIYDVAILKLVAYGIAPANAWPAAKQAAAFVTKRAGGDGAVAEACQHILKKFFPKANWPT